MFEHSGAKLKVWAKIIAWVGIIASVITGIVVISGGAVMRYYMSDNLLVWPGILIMVVGSLASWIGSLFIYTFGDIAEQTEAMRKKLDALQAGESPKNS